MSRAMSLAVESFLTFCEDAENWSFRVGSVEECIELWLEAGNATRACAGEFQIFVGAVVLIFAQWHDERFVQCKSEAEWHWNFPWRITRALKGEEVSTDILDPLYFRYCYAQDSTHSKHRN